MKLFMAAESGELGLIKPGEKLFVMRDVAPPANQSPR